VAGIGRTVLLPGGSAADPDGHAGDTAAGAHFLIGAPSFELRGKQADYFNSAYLVGPGGEVLGKYDKAHLVPYGEYTPFKEYLPSSAKL